MLWITNFKSLFCFALLFGSLVTKNLIKNLSPKFLVTNLSLNCHWNTVTKKFVSEKLLKLCCHYFYKYVTKIITKLSSNISVINKFVTELTSFFSIEINDTKIFGSFFIINLLLNISATKLFRHDTELRKLIFFKQNGAVYAI